MSSDVTSQTAQFRIDRPCLGCFPPRPIKFPITASVYLPAEKRTIYASMCDCTEVYRLTEDSLLKLAKLRGQLKEAPRAYVCPCMGEVIK